MRAPAFVFAVASLLALTAFRPSTESFKKAMDDFVLKRNELFKSGSAKAADHDKLVADLFSKIEIPKLDVDDIGSLSKYNLLNKPEHRTAALERLKTFHGEKSAVGALALALSTYNTTSKELQAERQAFALQFLNHKNAADVMRGPSGRYGTYALMILPASAENSPKVLALARDFESWDPEAATTGDALLRMLKTHASTDLEQEAYRVRVVAFMRKVASKTKDSKMAEFINGQAARMDGAAARGMLLNHSAPELKIAWSSNPKIKSLADLKGKVVVLDFWATWCGPCVGSFPNVKELQAHYKGYDVEIVGVTSLQGNIIGLGEDVIDTAGDPAKEFKLMGDYIKAKELTWSVVFSEQDVFNPDYGVEGIPHVTIIDPSGKVRYNGLHPADPLAEKTEKINALLKEFGLKTPAN